ncbi:MAG TPA: hypothetical protein VF126_19045 [Acidobacteriaceae bacterium]|jgi:hypothetical protein
MNIAESSEVVHMTTREAKRIWRHRQAMIAAQIRNLEKSPEKTSRDGGIIRRIIHCYKAEWTRYQQLIHASDRCRMQTC